MGRSSKPTIAVLPHAAVQIDRFLGKDQTKDNEYDQNEDLDSFSYGLLIGQCPKGSTEVSSKKEEFIHPVSYIVYFARTPIEVKEDEEGNDEEEEENVQSLDQVDPEWVMEHAKQVSIMLPGGIRVLGIFFADQQKTDTVLKSVLVDNCLDKIDAVTNVAKKTTSYLVMHLNKKTGTQTCELVSYAEGTSAKARKSTDIEPTPSNFRWQVITSKFLFDYPIIFKSGEETEQPILKKIKIALSMVERNLDSSNILLNNTYRSKMDELLDEKLLAEEAKSKKKNVSKAHEDLDDDDEDYDDAVVKEYQAEILLDPEFTPAPDEVEVVDVSSRMRLSGRMAIRAFLHPRATVREAVEAVKEDLVKSLNARCDMHCDSLVGEEIGGAGDEIPVLHEPPRRVFIKLPESEVTISDFLFPGESTEASVKAVEEMFGFMPELEDLDDEQELVASPKQVVSGDGDDKMAGSATLTTAAAATSPSRSPLNLSILLSLAVVLVGVIFSYFYAAGSPEDEESLYHEEKIIPPTK